LDSERISWLRRSQGEDGGQLSPHEKDALQKLLARVGKALEWQEANKGYLFADPFIR
jgi:hypothetical protein